MSKKICFIINPRSGKGDWKGVEKNISLYLDKSFTPTILHTERPGHATELAREAAQTNDIIVAVGGDGMMNETALGMLHSRALLGIIPTGSGNALARHLGIPMDQKGAIECINKTHNDLIDTATVNGKPFFAVAGTGFDAEVAAKFAASTKRGFWTYLKLSFTNFFTYKPSTYTIVVDGKTYKEKAFLVSIANGSQYGNNAYIAPNASLQNSTLDVCIIKPFPWIAGLFLAYRLFTKSIHKSRYVKIIRGREIEISNSQQEEYMCIHYDGETEKAVGLLNINILPAIMRVIFPKGNKI
jgi:YegS/Rv2252/BmrU family lipid kinase